MVQKFFAKSFIQILNVLDTEIKKNTFNRCNSEMKMFRLGDLDIPSNNLKSFKNSIGGIPIFK